MNLVKGFSFWSYSASVKTQLQADMLKLKNDIEPLQAWVLKTKKEHEEAGTDVNRDVEYVKHAGRLIAKKTEFDIKQQMLNQLVKIRMEQYQIWQANKALQNAEAFADTGICTA
jgi:hypothetical protein